METKVAGGAMSSETTAHWPELLEVIGARGSATSRHCPQLFDDLDGSDGIIFVSQSSGAARTWPEISKESSIRHLKANEEALNQIMKDDDPMCSSTIEHVLSALSRLSLDEYCVCPSTSFLGNIVDKFDGSNFRKLWTQYGGFWNESTYAQAVHVVYVVLLRESSNWVMIGVDRSSEHFGNIIAMGPFPDETTTTFLLSSGGKGNRKGQELAAYVRAVRDVDIMLTSTSVDGSVHDADVHKKKNYSFAANRVPQFDGSICGLLALNAARHFVQPDRPVCNDLWAMRKYIVELYIVDICDQSSYFSEQQSFHKRSRQRGGETEGEGR